MAERPTLALDIGTRKVAGLLTVPGPKGLKIIAAERLEHATRAMYDGQIHDVGAVAAVVQTLLQRLSEKAGFRPTEAAVAAAGRALRTFKGTAAQEFSGLTALTRDEVLGVELEAVQAAQAAMASAMNSGRTPQEFHYVGHSVMAQRLDGLPIGNLLGQRGNLAEVDVIATFLPRGVVDSLEAVLAAVGLEMSGLTLEPIAALGVAVPPTMRHLNLVLVDIGAGTSDIAITRKGTVVAYDMVPVAGDEITEALSELYLLDFPTGETVKRQIGSRETVAFTDILGHRQTVPAARLTEELRPAVQHLAEQIATRVLRLNGGPPQAILLVGGGSLTPGLVQTVAREVGLPENRVAVRGRDAVAGVEGARTSLKGPDAITPIGIAVAARDRSTLGFQMVSVNGRGVRLFRPGEVSVADALLAAGIDVRQLQGSIGPGFTVTVNDSLRIVRGTFGKPASVLVNGEESSLEAPLRHRDQIEVHPGAPGSPGAATVADVAPEALRVLTIHLNGEALAFTPEMRVNGRPASPDTALADNDRVQIVGVRTVADVLARLEYGNAAAAEEEVRFSFMGAARVERRPHLALLLNGAVCTVQTPVRDGDQLEVSVAPPLTIGDVVGPAAPSTLIRINVNGQVMMLESPGPQLYRNGRPAGADEPVRDGDRLTLGPSAPPPIFADLLARLSVAQAPPEGKSRLGMRLNGAEADFTSPLKDGDSAEIRWE